MLKNNKKKIFLIGLLFGASFFAVSCKPKAAPKKVQPPVQEVPVDRLEPSDAGGDKAMIENKGGVMLDTNVKDVNNDAEAENLLKMLENSDSQDDLNDAEEDDSDIENF